MVDSLRVLLVEGNPEIRRRVADELRRGHPEAQLQQVSDTQALTENVGWENLDLAVVDARLGWSGQPPFLRTLRDRSPQCEVIPMIDPDDEEAAAEALRRGWDLYLVKIPACFLRLRAAVRSAAERIRERRRVLDLEAGLRSLLDLLDVGLFHCSVRGTVRRMNDCAVRILGLESPEQARGLSLRRLFAAPAEGKAFLKRVLQSGEPQRVSARLQCRPDHRVQAELGALLTSGSRREPAIVGVMVPSAAAKWGVSPSGAESAASSRLGLLSSREREVLDRVVAGKTSKAIARELNVSPKTVEMHRSHIMKKLRVDNVAELVRITLIGEGFGRQPKEPTSRTDPGG